MVSTKRNGFSSLYRQQNLLHSERKHFVKQSLFFHSCDKICLEWVNINTCIISFKLKSASYDFCFVN